MVEQDKNKRGKPNGEAEAAPLPDEHITVVEDALPGGDVQEVRVVSPEKRIRELEEALSAAEKKAEECYQQFLRSRADFENLRRRVNKEREEFLHFAGETLVASLLPVLDNFERALESPGEELNAFLTGVEMIYRQLKDVLAQEGLEAISAVGQEFDPTRHEAVAYEPGGEQPPNTIIAELRRGYTFRGKVLRPALVKVAKESET
ncbi:MAG: nucleotide exchange factor GrpE [Bacillota bacterium]